MTDPQPPGQWDAQRRLLLEHVEARLRVQFDELDGLDRKATTTLAATGVTLGLVVNNAASFAHAPTPVALMFNGALVLLAVGLVLGVAALWPRVVLAVPEPRQFLDQHQTSLPEGILAELISTKAEAFEANRKVVEAKGDRVRDQMFLLMAGGILLVGAYIFERVV